MQRRALLVASLPFFARPFRLAAASAASSLRGLLRSGERPAIVNAADGQAVALKGDEPTMGVFGDERLNNADFEALGSATAPGVFTVEPIHTRSLFVHKGGKRLMVTYWCDVCYIRTYTPGKCWCCQKDTDLDLRESLSD